MATAVLFDIDGTLVDHASAEHAGVHALLAVSGRKDTWSENLLTAWRSSSSRHFERYLRGERTFIEQRRDRIREIIDSGLADDEADQLFAAFAASYEANWKLFSDVTRCLAVLQTSKLGIVSNGDGEQQRRKLRSTSIDKYFDAVVISGDVGFAKPDHRIFEMACQTFGERPEDTVYIGDMLQSDAMAATAAGLRGIWLDRTGQGTAVTGIEVVGSLDEVPRIVCSPGSASSGPTDR